MKKNSKQNSDRLLRLIEESGVVKLSHVCFAKKLTGVVKEYLAALDESFRAQEPVVYSRVSDILLREFKLKIGADTIKKHILRGCRCPVEK